MRLCRCAHRWGEYMSKIRDLSGQKFGRLTVLEFAGMNKKRNSMWRCRCECGAETIVLGYKLTGDHTKSCGCLNKETTSKRVRKHGLRNSRIYNCWRGMNQRCHNPNEPAYPQYGGRGITVCDEWRHSFESFYEWSMANGYTDLLTIERENVDKGYSPENCCWADMKTQQNNRTNNHLITFNGKTQTLTLWAEEFGMKPGTLFFRIRSGWSVADALQTPVRKSVNGRYVYA